MCGWSNYIFIYIVFHLFSLLLFLLSYLLFLLSSLLFLLTISIIPHGQRFKQYCFEWFCNCRFGFGCGKESDCMWSWKKLSAVRDPDKSWLLYVNMTKVISVRDHDISWLLYVIRKMLIVLCNLTKVDLCMCSWETLIVVWDHEKSWFYFMQSWQKLIVVCDHD